MIVIIVVTKQLKKLISTFLGIMKAKRLVPSQNKTVNIALIKPERKLPEIIVEIMKKGRRMPSPVRLIIIVLMKPEKKTILILIAFMGKERLGGKRGKNHDQSPYLEERTTPCA